MNTSSETSGPVKSFEAFLKLVKSHVLTVADGVSDHPLNEALKAAWGASRVNKPVLITGPPGVDVESFARAIHCAGERKNAQFIPFQCGREDAPEGEKILLVGAAPPGENRGGHLGIFHDARGGTVCFLDIDRLSLPAQISVFQLLGGQKSSSDGAAALIHYPPHGVPVSVNVRVIAIVCPDKLPNLNDSLRYHLNQGIQIRLPSLAERKTDIPLLIVHYLSTPEIKFVSLDAYIALTSYSWPDNERDFRLFADGLKSRPIGPTVTWSAIQECRRLPPPDLGGGTLKEFLSRDENRMIEGWLNRRPRPDTIRKSLSIVARKITVSLDNMRLSNLGHISLPRIDTLGEGDYFNPYQNYQFLIYRGKNIHVGETVADILKRMCEYYFETGNDEFAVRWLKDQLNLPNPMDNLRKQKNIWNLIVDKPSHGAVRLRVLPRMQDTEAPSYRPIGEPISSSHRGQEI